ncbi:CBS domain-containing protein [Desulfurivibrio sp. C05AmB]|uniref:CBS domain-containing protein n=1 Tax=Desulfurivibrio sp. C05AmB TaxID=3374371 RepID=UPI00376EAA6D
MPIREFCNREVVVVDRQCPVREAARLMRNFHVGNVVVVDVHENSRMPVGIVTDRDLVVEIMARDVDPALLTVGDVMGPDLFTVRESEDLLQVIGRMRARGVRRAPVVNDIGVLEGIITVDDLLELLAEQAGKLTDLIRHELELERQNRPAV